MQGSENAGTSSGPIGHGKKVRLDPHREKKFDGKEKDRKEEKKPEKVCGREKNHIKRCTKRCARKERRVTDS